MRRVGTLGSLGSAPSPAGGALTSAASLGSEPQELANVHMESRFSLRNGAAALRRAAISAWRWPQIPGELPLYVQRNFRLKTFGLLGVQMSLVFGIMVIVHLVVVQLNYDTDSQAGQLVFYGVGAATLLVLLWLHIMKDWFPLNYFLLLATSLLVGVFWGIMPFDSGHYIQFQVIGILAAAMLVSAVASAALTRDKVDPWSALFFSHLLGWILGSLADVIVIQQLGKSSPAWTLLAMVTTLILLTGVLLVDAGYLLVKCNPDDFLRVVVAMDSALLVVSMPIFVLSCCLLHSMPVEDRDGEEAADADAGGAP